MTVHYFSTFIDEDCLRCEHCAINILSAKANTCEEEPRNIRRKAI